MTEMFAKMRTRALAVSCVVISQAQADVLTGFQEGGGDAPSTTVTWTNLDGPVAVSADGVGNPTIDTVRISFFEAGVSGTIRLNVVALDDVTAPFDPATWSGGGTTEATIHTTSAGWGVNDSSGNGNLQAGEALILTFDLGGLSLGAGNHLVWKSADLGVNGAQIWRKRPNSGNLISSGSDQWSGILEVSHGDTFALVNSASSAMRLKSLVLDVVPDLDWDSSILHHDRNGRLVYHSDEDGNRIVDFSHAGYHSGEVPIPDLPVVHTISPIAGDNTAHIQAAIDTVAAMTPDANGHRGAILLTKGTYGVSGIVQINADGIVLRGEGEGPNAANNTIIIGTGTRRMGGDGIVELKEPGNPDVEEPGTRQDVISDYIPVGSRTFDVVDGSIYSVGDYLVIHHVPTAAWLSAVNYGNTNGDDQWQIVDGPGDGDRLHMEFHGTVTAIDGNRIKLDTPIYHALDRSLAQATVYRHNGAGLVDESGVENLRIDTEGASEFDEAHRWDCLYFKGTRNCWAKDVTVRGFADSGIQLRDSTRCTILDCSAINPLSTISGGRRYNFSAYLGCHDILFKGCRSTKGRHSFVSNGAALVNGVVFTQCTSENAYGSSESHRLWGQGVLWDNISWTSASAGTVLGMHNFGYQHGWSGTESVAWNISAPGKILRCQKPPLGQHYAIGCDADIRKGIYPRGFVEGTGETIGIPSLYEAQLAERLTHGVGPDAPARLTISHYSNAGTRFVAMDWVDIALDEDAYVLERSQDGGTSFAVLATLPENTESYTDTSVAAGGSYVYRLKTANATGFSAYGNTASLRLSQQEAPRSVTYQAENFSARNNVPKKWDRHGYTGEGYMNLAGQATWFELEIDGGMGGTVPVTFRYSGDGTDPRPCDISVNGVVDNTATFTSTGSWDTWDTETVLLTLAYGTNTIRIQPNSGVHGPDVDRLDVAVIPVIYAAGESPEGAATSRAGNAFDGDTNTLWRHASPLESWIQQAFPDGRQFLSYNVTSGTGAPANDPKDWELLGSNDGGSSWVTLDARSGVTFSSRQATRPFRVTSSGNYRLYRLEVTAVQDSALADSVQLAELELSLAPGPDYDQWATLWGVDIGSPTDDHDGDLRANLYEYAVNGDPTDPADHGVAPRIVKAGGELEFIHLMRTDDSDLVYSVETSPDLTPGSWTEAGFTVRGVDPAGGAFDEIRYRIPMAAGRGFIRLRVEYP